MLTKEECGERWRDEVGRKEGGEKREGTRLNLI
jgi:hypothetical protein